MRGSLTFHIMRVAIWTHAMCGFNVSSETFPYYNRPVAPRVNYTSDQRWFPTTSITHLIPEISCRGSGSYRVGLP